MTSPPTTPELAVAGDSAAREEGTPATIRRWLWPTLLLLFVLLALDRATLPRVQVQQWSDVLQLGLALAAGGLCARAAAGERSLGRVFWSLITLGVLIWAAGQTVWTLESVALHPFTTISVADLLFLACSTPFMIVALVRPDRPRGTSVGLAFDASLLLVLLLYADAYFVLGELVAGDPAAFQAWQTRLLGVRGIVVLLVFLALCRSSRPPWKSLYEQLGLALALLYGVGAVVNVFLATGHYRPGLLDLGWTVPFLWIAQSAAGWAAEAAPPARPLSVAVPEWRDTRRGTVLALLAVILVPAVHFVSTSFGAPNLTLQRLRGSITVATTVVVGALFLVRQLHLLRRVEQAQAEREATLRSSEERFQKAFRASPAAMSISTFPEGRLLDVNDRYAELTGYSREELIGRTVAELGLWVGTAEHEALVGSVERGSPHDTELKYRRKSGEIRAARTSYELVEVSGEACLLGLSEDVSDWISLEAQLRQAQKMEAVGRLAGGIAHDFNNLLTAILGYTGLMLRRFPEGDSLRNNALEIQKAGNRAAELTRQLLAFSRKQVLIPQILDLRMVVTDIEGMLRRLIGEDIELVTSTRAAVGAVRADGGQLNQVILNLAVNARDAMPSGGRLTIAVRNAELGEAFLREHPGARGGPHVLLSVSDTGVGMSPETQSHVFEPFFTTKEVGKGTGLGLATVYGIVKQSDGYIAVKSALGRGSTFDVYLPRVDGTAERPRAERVPLSAPRGTETVLLVEDEEAVRGLVHEILESAGYRVLTAKSGPEALLQSRNHDGPIHLMITDVVMPGMSGPQLADRIKGTRPSLRILYTSGHADDALAPLGVLERGHAFMQKPLTPDDLVGRVREVLDGPAPGVVSTAKEGM